MGWKKIIIGEKVPDLDDPSYKDLREKNVEAGKIFAQKTRLDKGAAVVQRFASHHTKIFLALVFGFVLFSVGLNVYRMTTAVRQRPQTSSAIERQEKVLHFNRHHQEENERNRVLEESSTDNNNHKLEEYELYRKD